MWPMNCLCRTRIGLNWFWPALNWFLTGSKLVPEGLSLLALMSSAHRRGKPEYHFHLKFSSNRQRPCTSLNN
eukprot:c39065_g1_i1 orf=113-328(-)